MSLVSSFPSSVSLRSDDHLSLSLSNSHSSPSASASSSASVPSAASSSLSFADFYSPDSANSNSPSSAAAANPAALYKTELCKSFSDTGFCRYGLKCRFAHGLGELRPVARPKKYKTEQCKNFVREGICRYGSRCRFIHNVATADQDELPGLGPIADFIAKASGNGAANILGASNGPRNASISLSLSGAPSGIGTVHESASSSHSAAPSSSHSRSHSGSQSLSRSASISHSFSGSPPANFMGPNPVRSRSASLTAQMQGEITNLIAQPYRQSPQPQRSASASSSARSSFIGTLPLQPFSSPPQQQQTQRVSPSHFSSSSESSLFSGRRGSHDSASGGNSSSAFASQSNAAATDFPSRRLSFTRPSQPPSVAVPVAVHAHSHPHSHSASHSQVSSGPSASSSLSVSVPAASLSAAFSSPSSVSRLIDDLNQLAMAQEIAVKSVIHSLDQDEGPESPGRLIALQNQQHNNPVNAFPSSSNGALASDGYGASLWSSEDVPSRPPAVMRAHSHPHAHTHTHSYSPLVTGVPSDQSTADQFRI